MRQLLLCSLLCALQVSSAQPVLKLTPFASGFKRPVDIAHCGDNRLFVAEQTGYIWIVDSMGNKASEPFLDIRQKVFTAGGNEQGLLGIAFHPNYKQNGYFYVYYTKYNKGDTRVSRFTRDFANPEKADTASEKVILEQAQPYPNHNGGCIKFGPKDGYLYIGLGDGGSAGDPNNFGQNRKTFLGKILRIDVDAENTPYNIPTDNPFVQDTSYKSEIWALGMRNPWRFSFDRQTNDLWIADVGQGNREEIDFEPAGNGGRNYGWRCYEGKIPYTTSGCPPDSTFEAPVFDYTHGGGNGCSVTGGFVYRGSLYPAFYGNYLFADFCSGRWWRSTLNPDNMGLKTWVLGNYAQFDYSSLGEDSMGELYVATVNSGTILKITDLCQSFQLSAVTSGPVCTGSQAGFIQLSLSGNSNNSTVLWSDGSTDWNRNNLNPGVYAVVATNPDGCVQQDSFEIMEALPPTLSLKGDSVICTLENNLIEIYGLPDDYNVQWYSVSGGLLSGETNDSLSTFWAGSYYAKAAGACGIVFSDTLNVKIDSVALPFVRFLNDTLRARLGFSSYQWSFNGIEIPGAIFPFWAPLESGLYNCTIETQAGCTYSEGVQVYISQLEQPKSVIQIALMPNPSTGTVQLKLELDHTRRLLCWLTDIKGNQIFFQSVQLQNWNKNLELGALPAGTYFLHMDIEGELLVRKIIKQ